MYRPAAPSLEDVAAETAANDRADAILAMVAEKPAEPAKPKGPLLAEMLRDVPLARFAMATLGGVPFPMRDPLDEMRERMEREMRREMGRRMYERYTDRGRYDGPTYAYRDEPRAVFFGRPRAEPDGPSPDSDETVCAICFAPGCPCFPRVAARGRDWF
jgi:hypothetical protein